MPRVVLTARDKAEILSVPEGTTVTDLVRWLRRPFLTIAQFQSRVRRAGGWYTAVRLADCAWCSRLLVRSRTRRLHRECAAERDRLTSRARYRRAAAVLNAKHAELIATLPHGLAVRLGLLPAD